MPLMASIERVQEEIFREDRMCRLDLAIHIMMIFMHHGAFMPNDKTAGSVLVFSFRHFCLISVADNASTPCMKKGSFIIFTAHSLISFK